MEGVFLCLNWPLIIIAGQIGALPFHGLKVTRT